MVRRRVQQTEFPKKPRKSRIVGARTVLVLLGTHLNQEPDLEHVMNNRSRKSCRKLALEPLEHRYAPATFNVTTTLDVVDAGDGLLSLREAINDANATAELDRIVLPAGTFAIQLQGNNDDANLFGDFDITNPVIFKGVDAASTIIDADRLDRAFNILGPASGGFLVKFRRMTIQNGFAADDGGAIEVRDQSTTEFSNLTLRKVNLLANYADSSGGAVRFNEAGNLTMRECEVTGNSAFSGGAVRMDEVGAFRGDISALDCVFSDNYSESNGGALFSTGNVTLTNTTLSNNFARLSGGGLHQAIGGIPITMLNCLIDGNIAGSGDGGGIDASSSLVNLTDCTISNNRSGDRGGGLYGDSGSTLVLERCTVADNESDSSGGGILASDLLTITNSTISGNRTQSDGGGICMDFGSDVLQLTNVTVTGNLGNSSGGIFLGMSGTGSATLLHVTITRNAGESSGGLTDNTSAPITLKNCLIAGNRAANDNQAEADVSGDFISLGHNLIGISGGTNGFVNGTNGDQVGTEAAPLDPQLLDLANNGGPTQTHALKPTSTALDAGDNTGTPATDQRGLARIADGDGNTVATVDIGAFEL
jgi:predicted outer membrane repeat protein